MIMRHQSVRSGTVYCVSKACMSEAAFHEGQPAKQPSNPAARNLLKHNKNARDIIRCRNNY
eukprot:scaffold326356_cov18-Prasinocladus_malaysianus.AAC.1